MRLPVSVGSFRQKNLIRIQIVIVTNFNYLGIVFTPGGSFSDTQDTLSGQALKNYFQNGNTFIQMYTYANQS